MSKLPKNVTTAKDMLERRAACKTPQIVKDALTAAEEAFSSGMSDVERPDIEDMMTRQPVTMEERAFYADAHRIAVWVRHLEKKLAEREGEIEVLKAKIKNFSSRLDGVASGMRMAFQQEISDGKH